LKIFQFKNAVEIDETFFRKKKSINNKTKMKRKPIIKLWIIGIIDRKNRNFIINIINNKSSKFIIPIILERVPFGQTIYSESFLIIFIKKEKKGPLKI